MTREEELDWLYRLRSELCVYIPTKEWLIPMTVALNAAISSLEHEPELQNRCYSLTKGTMCGFCKYECQYRVERNKKE